MKKIFVVIQCSLLMVFMLIVQHETNAQFSNQQNNKILFKLEDGKIFRTSDGIGIWSTTHGEQTVSLSEQVKLVIWDRYQPERVLAVGTNAVWMSYRAGRNWMPTSLFLPPQFEPTSLAIMVSNSMVVFLTGTVTQVDGSLLKVGWRSSDGGLTWTIIQDIEAVLTILSDSTKFWYAAPNTIKEKTEDQR